MRTSVHVLAVLICCPSFAGFAQQGTPPSQIPPVTQRPGFAAAQPGRFVTLDVVVTDPAGHPVPGLQQQDFTILDDKVPRTILSFRATEASSEMADRPLRAILILDAVNTSVEGIAYQRQELTKFLRQGDGALPLPMSLLLLTETAEKPSVATRDRNELLNSLTSMRSGLRTITRAQGFYGGADRTHISLNTLARLASYETTQPGRKLVIWLGPGWPLLSGPSVRLSDKTQEALFQNIVKLSTELREAGITIYNVGLLGMTERLDEALYFQGFLKGVASAGKVQPGNLALQVLAIQSGGRVLNASSDIAASIATCLKDVKAFYTLSFDSSPADHRDEYHSLQVRIDRPKLTAHTRTGYYAQP